MRKVICFGAGKYLEKYFKIIKSSSQILYICDNDSSKWGKDFIYEGVSTGVSIVSPNILEKLEGSVQLLITSTFYDEIAHQLMKMGKNTFYVVGGYGVYLL